MLLSLGQHTRKPLVTKSYQFKMSIVLRLKNPAPDKGSDSRDREKPNFEEQF